MTPEEEKRAIEAFYNRNVKAFAWNALKAVERDNMFRALYEASIVGMWMHQIGWDGAHDPFREVLRENEEIDRNIVTPAKVELLREYSRVGRQASIDARQRVK